MKHIIFEESPTYKVAVLIKESGFKQDQLEKHYVDPVVSLGVDRKDIIGFNLKYDTPKKVSAKNAREYFKSLLPALDSLGVNTLYVCDGPYFKFLTKVGKLEPNYGYILPCKEKGFEHFNVILSANYSALFFNPDIQQKITMANETLANHVKGTHVDLGSDIIHSESYPDTHFHIENTLASLHKYPALTCDIETFGLAIDEGFIGTISFAWDKHNGIAFACDYEARMNTFNDDGFYGRRFENMSVRKLLLEFFIAYKGKLIFHNACFDIKHLIVNLWMDNGLLDYAGMLDGIEVMNRDTHCTQVITYLATNSTAGNNLSLKYNAHEFAGNYAQEDIKDIRKIEKRELLRYNLVDCLSTWYVYDKYWPTVVADNQTRVYEEIMRPSIPMINQMELTGMPLNMKRVKEVRDILDIDIQRYLSVIQNSSIIQHFEKTIQTETWLETNLGYVSKVKTREEFDDIRFNPASPPQLQRLLYTELGYDVIDLTDAKQPATGAKTLAKLLMVVKNDRDKELLEALVGLSRVTKIQNTFVNAFLNKSILKSDGVYYLHGNFKLGGTVSGRLSSSNVNLQNLPSTGSIYAKLIKSCFEAPEGWLWVGADFASLEDRISALTTNDPNKLKVYTDNFDGHCLRAFTYFSHKMPNIHYVGEVNNERGFQVDISGKTHYIKSGTMVQGLNGTPILIEDYYDSINAA